MRQVAPRCRIAFVTDGGLTSLDWANWKVLRQGISRSTVTNIQVPENDRDDLAFVGQLYGERQKELAPLHREYALRVVSQVFGRKLSALIRRHRIIIGPRYQHPQLLERQDLRHSWSRRVLPRPRDRGNAR